MANFGSIVSEVLSSGIIPSQVNAYDMAYQISPIILVGGIAGTPGATLPIIYLMGQSTTISGLASLVGGLDTWLARYLVIPGGTLINNVIGTYPFANQQVAANAIIQQPLNISLEMIAPVKDAQGYYEKQAIFTSLQNSLNAHNNAGGTYNVSTPAFLYTNCLMTSMTDITSGETNQKQVRWQMDFVQPLITQQQADQSFNSLMGKISTGGQITSPNWSGNPSLSGSPAQGAQTALTGLQPAITYPLSP